MVRLILYDAPCPGLAIPIQYPLFGIERDKVYPLVVIEMPQDFMASDQLIDTFTWRFDDRQQSHRLMVRHVAVHDCLLSQSKPEIAPRSRHDAEPPHDVVIDLAAASEYLIVDGRKVMFHIDPLGHDLWGGQQDFEQPIARVCAIIIGMQEDASFEVKPSCHFPSPDDEGRVTRKTPLRSDLAPVGAPSTDVRCRVLSL